MKWPSIYGRAPKYLFRIFFVYCISMGPASKRIGNDEDIEIQGFRKVVCATSFCQVRQGISFFHIALLECPLLLVYYIEIILIRYRPWPWNIGACLRRGAYAELARDLCENTALFSEKGRQIVRDIEHIRYLYLGADLPDPNKISIY